LKLKYLTREKVDGIFRERLQMLEAMQLNALLNERIQTAMGDGAWDADVARRLLADLDDEWERTVRGLE